MAVPKYIFHLYGSIDGTPDAPERSEDVDYGPYGEHRGQYQQPNDLVEGREQTRTGRRFLRSFHQRRQLTLIQGYAERAVFPQVR